MISAQCPECQSGANSNKRGCGPPVKAQATARVDVPHSPRVSCVDQGVQHECKFLLRMLGYVLVLVRQTDRDLESSSTRRRVNARICAQRATDRDLESVFVKRKVNARNMCSPFNRP